MTLFTGVALGQMPDAESTADSLMQQASKLYGQDVNAALQTSQRALNIAREHNLEKAQYKAYAQMGSMYTNMGFYNKALEELHKGLGLARKRKWLSLEAEILTSMGNVYYFEDSLQQALHYYKTSLRFLNPQKISELLARNYTNIGLVNLQLETADSAAFYIKKALQMSQNMNYTRGVCINYQNLGSLHLLQNKLDSAHYMFNLANELADKHPELEEQIYIYQGIAKVYREQKRWKESKSLLLNALELSKKSVLNTSIKPILKDLSEQEALEGNYRKALEYAQRYSKISDSLHILAQRTEQLRFFKLLDTEQSSNENKLLKANVAARELELRASRADQEKQLAISVAAIVALGLALCFTLFFFYHYRQGQKNHQKLQQMHAAIQKQAQELEEAYQQIQQHNTALENNIEERTRQLNLQNRQLIQYAYFNAHKVRGPLARILGLVNLMPKAAHPLEADFIMERLEESAKELDKVVHEINLILEVKQPQNQDN